MKILFAGELWSGATGLSVAKALRAQGAVVETLGIKSGSRTLGSRIAGRILRAPLNVKMEQTILARLEAGDIDVFLTCKGWWFSGKFIERIRSRKVFTANFYPDLCPLSHGVRHRESVGHYDLVISAKRAHTKLWAEQYGYRNPVEHVPHGYDSDIHLRREPASSHSRLLGLSATWRPGYGSLVSELAGRLASSGIVVTVCGAGWAAQRRTLPTNVEVLEALHGDAYIDFLRQCRICIAPVSPEFEIDGFLHPGDEDTTRTYELAAAWCFYIHRRTGYVRQIFDEATEVPMFADAEELAHKVREYVSQPACMDRMAAAAHRRAVPRDSIELRARRIRDLIAAGLASRSRQIV